MRLLLLNKAADSFHNLKTVNGKEYTSYQEAAVAENLVKDDNEAELCFADAIAIQNSPHQLRSLFISLAMQGKVIQKVYKNITLRYYMYQDFLQQCNGNTILAENKMLEIFSLRFRLHDKCNSDFGLPEPTEYKSELDIEKLRYDPNQQKKFMNNCTQEILQQNNKKLICNKYFIV
jgi:hypothetical protein